MYLGEKNHSFSQNADHARWIIVSSTKLFSVRAFQEFQQMLSCFFCAFKGQVTFSNEGFNA